jgi:hypothetical protein
MRRSGPSAWCAVPPAGPQGRNGRDGRVLLNCEPDSGSSSSAG